MTLLGKLACAVGLHRMRPAIAIDWIEPMVSRATERCTRCLKERAR